jgi:ABC-2 type transport system ATP-binding protein
MSESAIEVAGLTKSFGSVTAVDHLSFSVDRGEIFGLVGPDGAGKTTTVRMIAGVMRPDAGTIMVDGVDVVTDPEAVKPRVSYMPQRFGLYEDLTVDENIRFYAEIFEIPRKLRIERAERLLAASNMLQFRQRLAGQLSGGMKQKLGLTCALIHAPRAVLLDEPTTGVDPVSRRDFWRILFGLRADGVTILISTAYLDEAERCSRLALLNEGRVLHCDTPASLKAKMPGAMLAVISPSMRDARDLVAKLPGVENVLLVGDGIHIHVDDAARRIPELTAALNAAGIVFEPVRQVIPSVEDLFVSLTEREEKAA